MARQLSVIVCLALACSGSCLAGTELVIEGLPSLRAAAREPADAGSPRAEEESSSQVAPFVAWSRTDLRNQFELVDRNGDGFLSPAEAQAFLRALLPTIGLQATRTTYADTLVRAADSGGDGKISFDDYFKYAHDLSQQDAKKLLSSVDLDDDGFGSKAELSSMYRNLGVEVQDAARFDAVFRRADNSGDGKLDLAEFVAAENFYGASRVAAGHRAARPPPADQSSTSLLGYVFESLSRALAVTSQASWEAFGGPNPLVIINPGT